MVTLNFHRESNRPVSPFRKILRAELLESRDVPSVVGLGDNSPTPITPPLIPPVAQSGDPLLGQYRGRFAVGTDGGGTAQVNVYDAQTNALLGILTPFGTNAKHGVAVATGDVTGDGVEDIIVAAGRGASPVVKVFDGATLRERVSFSAYSTSFRGGVSVAVGDVTGDGRADIVVGAGIGSAPHIKAFSGSDLFALPGSVGNTTPRAVKNFFAFDAGNRAGVSVAVGDVNGDGRGDIVVGTGVNVAAQVRVFSGVNNAILADHSVGTSGYTGGVSVAAGNVHGSSHAEIIVGQLTGGSRVWIYDQTKLLNSYTVFNGNEGVRVAVENTHNDARVEVVASVVTGQPRVKVVNGFMGITFRDFPGFLPHYNQGLTVG